MGYDVVGIVVSDQHRADGLPKWAGTGDGGGQIGEKWARRAVVFSSPSVNADTLREASSSIPQGVAAVCALVDDQPVGLVPASFGFVSMKPALVSIQVARDSDTWSRLRARPRLGLSLLAASQDRTRRALARAEADRFSGVQWTSGRDGAVMVHDASYWLDCTVHDEVNAGDQLIVLLNIEGLWEDPSEPPLVLRGNRP